MTDAPPLPPMADHAGIDAAASELWRAAMSWELASPTGTDPTLQAASAMSQAVSAVLDCEPNTFARFAGLGCSFGAMIFLLPEADRQAAQSLFNEWGARSFSACEQGTPKDDRQA